MLSNAAYTGWIGIQNDRGKVIQLWHIIQTHNYSYESTESII